MKKNNNVLKLITLTLLLVSSYSYGANFICEYTDANGITRIGTFNGLPQLSYGGRCVESFIITNNNTINNTYKAKEEKKYLGLTKRELLVIGLSIGIGFAIADYQIRLNANSIKVSVPID